MYDIRLVDISPRILFPVLGVWGDRDRKTSTRFTFKPFSHSQDSLRALVVPIRRARVLRDKLQVAITSATGSNAADEKVRFLPLEFQTLSVRKEICYFKAASPHSRSIRSYKSCFYINGPPRRATGAGLRTLQIYIGIALAAIVIRASAQSASVMMQVDSRDVSPPTQLSTFGGFVEFTSTMVHPSSAVTVLFLADTFESSQLDQARHDVLGLARRLAGRQIRLVVLSGSNVETDEATASVTRLEKELDQIGLATAQSESAQSGLTAAPAMPQPPAAVFDSILNNADKLGSRWSALVVVANTGTLTGLASDFAAANLTRTLNMQQVRVYVLSAGGSVLDSTAAATGGVVSADPAELSAAIDERKHAFIQLNWTPHPAPAGFVLVPARITADDGKTLLQWTDMVDAGTPLSSVTAVASAQEQLRQASAELAQKPNEKSTEEIGSLLKAAGQVNPVDPVLLQLEAAFCERAGTYGEEVKAAALLVLVRPEDGLSFVLLGHAQRLATNYDEAERALNRAAELKIAPAQLAEEYAFVHLGLKDDAGALLYLQAAVSADAKRQDLWFVEASAAERTKENSLAIEALEHGLQLGGWHREESATLIRLYLDSKQDAKAHALATQTIESAPADAGERAWFADALEHEGFREEALAGWKAVLAVRKDDQAAYVRIDRLLLAMGRVQDALDSASQDVGNYPQNPDLYLVKADVENQLGLEYQMHLTLEDGAATTGAISVLTRLAATQDLYGYGAADAYGQLYKALGEGASNRKEVLERGCFDAVRDNELDKARQFAEQIMGSSNTCAELLGATQSNPGDEVLIPGGRDALAFIAYTKKGAPEERFLWEFASALITNACVDCHEDPYRSKIQKYFQLVGQLESMGRRSGNKVSIELSLEDKQLSKNTEELLHLLGLEIKGHGAGKTSVEIGTGQNKGDRQDIMSALALDEVGLADALGKGQTYTIELMDEPATVYPSGKAWPGTGASLSGGGFAEALLNSPKLTRLYVAIGSTDRPTATVLLQSVPLSQLSNESVRAFALYSSCFAVRGASAVVPGGSSAKTLWSGLVDASPDQPGQFFLKLIQAQNTHLLPFFYQVSELDQQHQMFITANPERVRRFLELFGNIEARAKSSYVPGQVTSLAELMSSIPLDAEGHLDFPGSPEVWGVAKGKSADASKISKMMRAVGKTTTADEEDTVLLRLADTHYKVKYETHSELDNFLAVSHLDAHRVQPLDEESALLLAQRYGEYWPTYSYFNDLRSIDLAGFKSFFDLLDAIKQLSPVERNMALGQVHALVEWLAILRLRGTIEDAFAATLFEEISSELRSATDEAARTTAALRMARTILHACSPQLVDADAALKNCMIGSEDNEFSRRRARDYAMVMDMQKVPSLTTLLGVQDALAEVVRKSAAGQSASSDAQAVQKMLSGIPSVAVSKQLKSEPKEKDSMERYLPDHLNERAGDLLQDVTKRKLNPSSIEKSTNEVLKEMEPQVTAALAGAVYAVDLRSSDLIVSEDPLLLRKHRYFNLTEGSDLAPLAAESDFVKSSEGMGSHFEGGLAQFVVAAGRAAETGWPEGGNGMDWVVAAQIAGLRVTPWNQLTEKDQRVVSLRILAARELIVTASSNAAALDLVSAHTTGILSPARRSALLGGIADRDWVRVWDSVYLPDLFMLGTSIESVEAPRLPDAPALSALRRMIEKNQGAGANGFGRVPYTQFGCTHPHVLADRPYEAYESRMPEELAERSADLKLYLAYRADSLGVAPVDLGRVAEPLARSVFKSTQMTDYKDWRSLLASYSAVENKKIVEILQ